MVLIHLQDILTKIGFREQKRLDINGNNISSNFYYDFGNFNLEVIESIDSRMNSVFSFLGINTFKNTHSLIDFELPIVVESFEQGVALISYSLRKSFDARNVPTWYHQGLIWESHLPWEKKRRTYNRKPSATIEYDYFKLIVQKMRKGAEQAGDDNFTSFDFDGNTLTISCFGERIIAPANGIPWTSVTVKTKALARLSKRIKKENGTVFLWENKLHIADVAFLLVTEVPN